MKQLEKEDALDSECGIPFNQKENNHSGDLWKELEKKRDTYSPGKPRQKWQSLLFGQLIALIATSQNAASFTLEYGMGIVFPFFLMLHTYIILSLHLFFVDRSSENYTGERCHTLPFTNVKLKFPWWGYLCLSIMDVGPNFLTLLSLSYTSLTSTTLLGSLTVPSTMLVCRFLLGKVYKPNHYVGVMMCMTGGILIMWTDLNQSNSDETLISLPHSYFGDLLAVTAAILYGVSDAAGEYWAKHVDRVEYLGMLGLFGTVFTLILSFLLEREAILTLFDGTDTWLPVAGILFWYLCSLVSYYISSTLFYVKSDATLLNLSLQCSNIWAVIFSVVAFREFPPTLFYVALVLVVGGVFVYELCGKQSRDSLSARNSEMQPINHVDSSYQSIEA
jgi:solute carrier family 35 protein F1/2